MSNTRGQGPTEMADALNRRIHDDTIPADAPTVTAARGQRIAVGDLILSRRNDPTVDVRRANDHDVAADPVRNGNRWRVAAIDTETYRVAAERLDDKARVVFDNDYLREQVSLGYAVTVHSAQGVTADISHAVLSQNSSRALLYVAMTRGRQANTARIYERTNEAYEYGRQEIRGTHVADRREAADLLREILTNDQQAVTAHDYAARTPEEALLGRVRSLLKRRATATDRRNADYQAWQSDWRDYGRSVRESQEQRLSQSRARSSDYGIEL